MTTIHPFEEAGFGKAPYRFDGVTRNWFCAYPGDPGKPGGSCDYCGTGIAYEFWVLSVDGRRFKVGCDCIAKLAKKNNAAFTGDRLAYEADRAHKDLQRQQREQRAYEQRMAARAVFAAWYTDARQAQAAERPHPAIAGKTLADYIGWMRENGYALSAARFPELA